LGGAEKAQVQCQPKSGKQGGSAAAFHGSPPVQLLLDAIATRPEASEQKRTLLIANEPDAKWYTGAPTLKYPEEEVRTSPETRGELNSWKEIAEYLGVSVRAAQKWEIRRGMPVHRLPGGTARGPVYAVADELDAWKRSAAHPPTSRAWFLRSPLPTLALASILPVALMALYLKTSRSGPPATARLQDDILIIMDGFGRELWRKPFPVTLRAMDMDKEDARYQRTILIEDLDGDGTTEVLFAPRYAASTVSRSELICYSESGEVRWTFIPGKVVSTAKEPFDSYYTINQFRTVRLGQSRGLVVNSRHFHYYPNQTAILSPQGQVLREYWHPGHLNFLDVADFDADGVSELYLGGINNARKAATLVVLDAGSLEGAALEEATPAYQFQGLPAPREKYRLVFPRTCVNQRSLQYNQVDGLWVHPGSITVRLAESKYPNPSTVLYHFTADLKLSHFTWSDGFLELHRRLWAAGELDHELSAMEEAEMQRMTVLTPGYQVAQRSGVQ
jgi:hypothetical protein